MAWNRSSEKKVEVVKSGEQRNVHLKGIIAGALVAVGAGIAAWSIFSGSDDCPAQGTEHKAQGTIRKVTPAKTAQRGETPRPLGKEAAALTEAETNEVAEEKKPGVFAPGMIRLPNGLELRFKLPAEGETRQVLAGGKIWEIDSKGNIVDITPPPIFEKPFEGMLSALFERDGLVLPFQLKQYSEEEVRKMCKEPTLSYEDDTPEITAKRENVAMLKKAVLDFLDAGGKFEEFVDDMAKHSQNASIAQVTGVRDIHDLLANGKDHEALQYYKSFSEEMAEKGYGELRLPRAFKEALDEQQELEDAKR